MTTRLAAQGRTWWGWMALLLAAASTAFLRGPAGPTPANSVSEARLPRLQPDYVGAVIPPNICPLNFRVEEPGQAFHVRVSSPQGREMQVGSRDGRIRFPQREWRGLLSEARGHGVRVEVSVRRADARWHQFAPFTNRVALDEVDPYLVYRKIHPSHNTWSSMGIYQRNLETFQEVPVLENRRFGNDCCHCHSLRENDPGYASMDIRSSKFGNSLLLISNNVPIKVAGNVSFSAWHPNRRLVVSSFNKPRLLLHTVQNDMRDIVELDGWLGWFTIDTLEVKRIPGLGEDRLLTFPAWAPDGRVLYFCSSPNPWVDPAKTRNGNYKEIRFDLARVPFDPDTGVWGRMETLLTVAETGLSMVQPRISPDGRWLTFGMCDYGCWATYHPETDLYRADLRAARAGGKLEYQKMEINSPECESWHGWSSNSRWIVFSSKRGNPLFNRPHLSYVDAEGRFQKPFVVPQEDPDFYGAYLKTYTIPTLAKAPFGVSEAALVAAIKSKNPRTLVLPPANPTAPRPAEMANPLDPSGEDASKQQ